MCVRSAVFPPRVLCHVIWKNLAVYCVPQTDLLSVAAEGYLLGSNDEKSLAVHPGSDQLVAFLET